MQLSDWLKLSQVLSVTGRRHPGCEGAYCLWCKGQLQERLWADPLGPSPDAFPQGDYWAAGVHWRGEWAEYQARGPRDTRVGGRGDQGFNSKVPPTKTARLSACCCLLLFVVVCCCLLLLLYWTNIY